MGVNTGDNKYKWTSRKNGIEEDRKLNVRNKNKNKRQERKMTREKDVGKINQTSEQKTDDEERNMNEHKVRYIARKMVYQE